MALARALAASVIVFSGCSHAAPALTPKPNPGAERQLVADLTRIFNAPVMAQGLWGVEVKSLATGRILYSLNARKLMMPASNMKIVTLAAAAETLGWDYRFKTTIESSAEIENGTLKGDLVVVGTGDPTINSRDNRADAVFDQWATALKAAGITTIDGNLVADATAFETRGLGQGWSWDYLQDGYAAPTSALEFNENVATLTIRPGAGPGDEAALELSAGTGLGLVRRVMTSEAGGKTEVAVERPPNGAWLDVTGSIAADAQPISREVAVANPATYFAHACLAALVTRGIAVRGLPVERLEPHFEVTQPRRRVLVESFSPPLAEIATTMMKVSQNLYAETLLKAIGGSKGSIGTVAGGREATATVLDRWGIAPGSYVQADGSGLSRYDFVTADMIATILEHLYRDARHHDRFVATLPIAGKDGTISSRMKDTRAEGNAAAKTGSIANVRALSGYVRTRDGEMLVFSILANSFTIPAATVNWIADLAVETLAGYLPDR